LVPKMIDDSGWDVSMTNLDQVADRVRRVVELN
jgi:hypothetical protein